MPRHGGHLDSFYVSQEGLFVPGLMTVGPWDARFQHGGPPSALLGRALEGWGESQEWLLGRVTVELLRPVPLVPLRVEVEPVRVGRQAQWLESRLYDGDRLLALARGVRVRRRRTLTRTCSARNGLWKGRTSLGHGPATMTPGCSQPSPFGRPTSPRTGRGTRRTGSCRRGGASRSPVVGFRSFPEVAVGGVRPRPPSPP